MPPHPPTLPRETSWARAESGSRNSTHRNWFHEAFYSPQNADMDSDEESTEPQEESIRRQGRLDPHTTLQLLHEQMRLAGGPRRVQCKYWPPFNVHKLWLTPTAATNAEGPETSLERARAARRAAAAAVKFVASSAALASLEPVDLKTLTGDAKSKSRLLSFECLRISQCQVVLFATMSLASRTQMASSSAQCVCQSAITSSATAV